LNAINLQGLTVSELVATDASNNLVSITALPNGTTATTQAANDSSTKVATTAYVATAVAVETSRALTAEALLAPLASPSFTGTVSLAGSENIASGQVLKWNSDTGVSRLGAASLAIGNGTNGDYSGSLKLTAINLQGLTVSELVATDASKNLVSITALPNGTTATTQAANDSSTKVATTAYVATAVVAMAVALG
jgi:predicted transcriptional regulator